MCIEGFRLHGGDLVDVHINVLVSVQPQSPWNVGNYSLLSDVASELNAS